MREELLDQLTAVVIVILFFMLVGFAGWLTDYEDAPIKYQIRVEKIERPKYVRT